MVTEAGGWPLLSVDVSPGARAAAGRWLSGARESGNLIQEILLPGKKVGGRMGAAQLHPSADGVRRQFGGREILMDPKVAMLLPASLLSTHIYTLFHSLKQHTAPGQVLAPHT